MSTTKFEDLYDEVMPEIPGAPLPLALNAIRNSVIAFCNGSTVWRTWLDPIDVVANVNTYDVIVDSGTDLVQLQSLKFDGRKLTARDEDWLFFFNDTATTE